MRTIIASCIGSERVSEPYFRAAGAQQIIAGCHRAPRRTPKKNDRTGKRTPEMAKKRKGEQKDSKKTPKSSKTIKTFAEPKKKFLSVPYT
jgi:hypothetical protein